MRRLELLSNNEIKFIHSSSIRILEEVGVNINNARALKLLNAAGAEVDFEKKLAKPPQDLVESMVKKAPNRITLFGRGSKNLLRLGSHTHTYFHAGGLSPFIRDPVTGKQRKATKDDVIYLVRLVDFLPHINAFWAGTPASPKNVQQQVRDLIYAKIMFENSEKHCGLDVSNGFSRKILDQDGFSRHGGAKRN